jgi:hypothetical protein
MTIKCSQCENRAEGVVEHSKHLEQVHKISDNNIRDYMSKQDERLSTIEDTIRIFHPAGG